MAKPADPKRALAQFGALLETVFSRKMERVSDQLAFTRKYPNLFPREYDALRASVFAATQAAALWDLMKAYLEAYGRHTDDPNLIHYYKSDQLYQFLLEQSAKVDDPSLFETWSGFVKAKTDRDSNSFFKRYAELDPYFRREIDVFIAKEKERRRTRRSLLDVLRDEYERLNGKAPTPDQLRVFDPRPSARGRIENLVATVRNRWLDAHKERSEASLRAFSVALGAFSEALRELGRRDVLLLFQAVKQLDLPADTPELSENRLLLLRGLYALACIRLHGAGLAAGLYQKNLQGFTPEELEYFAGALKRSRFYYRSNLVTALSGKLRDPTAPLGAVTGLLDTFLLAHATLPELTLLELETTLAVQKRWTLVRDISDQIALASKNDDTAKLAEILSDPRQAEAVAALRELSSTKLPLTSGQALGSRVLAAGSELGTRGAAGSVSVAYVHPKDHRVFVEFSAMKPWLFQAPHAWVANQQYGEKLSEIHRATVGMVELTEVIFLAMGFLPVLIEAGFAGLIYEIAFTYATSKLEEQLAKLDPVLAQVLVLALGLFAPRPNFAPKLKVDLAEPVESSLLAEKLNFTPDRAVTDRGTAPANRATAELADAELEELLEQVDVGQDVLEMNSGVPLTRRHLNEYAGRLKPGYSRVPAEWKEALRQSGPLRKLVRAALEEPNGRPRLVRITEKQSKALPFKYQSSSMGSDYELHLTLGGQEYKFDGIIIGADGSSWIGESKFTFKDMLAKAEQPMPNLHTAGTANPTTSYHYRFVDDAVAQFERYAEVAERFGFKGVAVMTNTEFLWQTFEQVTRNRKSIEIFLSRLEEELPEFAERRGTSAPSRGTSAATKANGSANRAGTR